METVNHIKQWFELAVPAPTDKNRAVQIGVHFEEFDEMLGPLGVPDEKRDQVQVLAATLKTKMEVPLDSLCYEEKVELLDSLCDQIVTAVGVAHMFGLNICGALAEVNASNWSKFVEGKPIFNEHGKIAKGPNYRKPVLLPFVPQEVTDAQVK
jgi:hypothetical protein